MYNRKDFLKLSSLVGLGALSAYFGGRKFFSFKEYDFPVKISGANFKAGHLLREGISEIPKDIKEIETVIVGGGIAGLSAGWYLLKNGYKDFLILEMDNHVGGNSSSGENSTSQYPYGAHYVPLPGENAKYVRELFEELKIITGYKNGLPVYDEFYLCADPNERLYFQGLWQEGIIPARGIPVEDKKQYNEFFGFVESLKTKKGNDGKFLFAIPIEFSSKDSEYLELDKISMLDFMNKRGWTSKYLHWYVEYSCRDDYGVSHSKVSAWAGLHYFASRAGKAYNADSQTVLTWSSGNGFLVNKLREINLTQIKTNTLTYRIEKSGEREFLIDTINPENKATTRYKAKKIIYAAPRYSAKKVIQGYKNDSADTLDFSPWLVANITLKQKPSGNGVPLSWDNVSFYSRSLGYIVANHQDLKINRKEVVITYYLPLDEGDLKSERLKAFRRSKEDWIEMILPDLEKMHAGITKEIKEMDLWVWGHGMVSPGIDYLWSDKRQAMLKPFQGIEFAHSDMSGISIFEEAQYRGCEAAKKILLG
jgi:protoporphyrinogen oxidase